MKIILSRKGFDSAYGGCPSPILPNGRLISLPVPDPDDSNNYSDLKLDDKQTYFDLMQELNPEIKSHREWHILTKNTKCHLDPDLYAEIIKRRKNWRPCFGQMDAAQTHLSNQKVRPNDLFLFFGWFKQTEKDKNGKLRFKRNAPDLHIIFGYLQIGEILQVNNGTKIPDWMQDHPHAKNEDRKKNSTNNIYVAKDNLTWNKHKPGAGVFRFNDNLVLTKNGLSRSRWDLPDLFKKVEISYHTARSWKKEGYFQSADIGQEFVVKDNDKVENWAKQIIRD
ncbi:MAG: hypothetical protein WC499_03230 [Patescibacteria group bacterium]